MKLVSAPPTFISATLQPQVEDFQNEKKEVWERLRMCNALALYIYTFRGERRMLPTHFRASFQLEERS